LGDGFEVSVPAFEFDEMKQVLLSITHRIRHFLSAIDTTESEWSEWVNSTRSTVYVVSEESLTRWRIALVLASTGSDTEYKLVYIWLYEYGEPLFVCLSAPRSRSWVRRRR